MQRTGPSSSKCLREKVSRCYAASQCYHDPPEGGFFIRPMQCIGPMYVLGGTMRDIFGSSNPIGLRAYLSPGEGHRWANTSLPLVKENHLNCPPLRIPETPRLGSPRTSSLYLDECVFLRSLRTRESKPSCRWQRQDAFSDKQKIRYCK